MKRLNADPLAGSIFLITLVYFVLRAALGPIGLVNIVGSVAFAGICILIFRLAMYLRELQALLAMWLPIAVTTVAGVLLFYEGQGRDLGVGLLGEGNCDCFCCSGASSTGQLKNWHSARLGLNYAFPTPTGAERWL
ncbi:hypothetical protein ABIC08_008388 [Bradyrhizobium sp. RT9b]|uniref:hypothetical protein n=1 Tax=Bradyrhizobium sp. RT9b TaxID=3156385 RepID=UPI0033976A8C